MRHQGLRAERVDKLCSLGLPARLLGVRMLLTIAAVLSLLLTNHHDRGPYHAHYHLRLSHHDLRLRLRLAYAGDPEGRT